MVAGTVGGGLLEGEVQQIAQHVLISGVSDQYYFNLDSDPGEDGAICGGEAEVLVDANPSASGQALKAMADSLSGRKGGYMATVVSKNPGNGRSIERFWITGEIPPLKPAGLDQIIWGSISEYISGKPGPGFKELSIQSVFIEPMNPMPHLVIAGAGHVGKALAHLGALLDFEITVIDDRHEFANRGNIPDADRFIVDDIGTSMQGLNPGADTYIVIVTRGHDHDAEALKPCVGSNAAYIGMIGSANKVAIMKKKFMEKGWATEEQWSGIHTPVGIPIGSKSVQEIAVSIAAQLVRVRSQIHSEYVT
ncbi:MAG: XdhC family protein [Bacteroidota bacterium]